MVLILIQYFFWIHLINGRLVSSNMVIRGLNFVHDYAFDGAFLNHGLLWQVPVMSLIHCAIRCAENRACISLHFHKGVRKCRGYEILMLTPQAGTNEEGWIYYYSTQKGNLINVGVRLNGCFSSLYISSIKTMSLLLMRICFFGILFFIYIFSWVIYIVFKISFLFKTSYRRIPMFGDISIRKYLYVICLKLFMSIYHLLSCLSKKRYMSEVSAIQLS